MIQRWLVLLWIRILREVGMEIEEELCELVRWVESRMVHTGTSQHGLFWV